MFVSEGWGSSFQDMNNSIPIVSEWNVHASPLRLSFLCRCQRMGMPCVFFTTDTTKLLCRFPMHSMFPNVLSMNSW